MDCLYMLPLKLKWHTVIPAGDRELDIGHFGED